MTPALELQSVSHVFDSAKTGRVVALDEVSLKVDAGSFVCVVGASGSGKSTLLRLIDGLIEPSAGQVLVNGAPVTGPGQDRAMVFQSDNLLPWQTVGDNTAYGLRLAGMSKGKSRDIARHFLRMVGLQDFEKSYPHQLSGGMRQRANVARALTVGPDILLMDEPFAALDAQTRELMQAELLRIWAEEKRTVVFITHQIDEAVYLADKVVVLSARPGRVREVVDVALDRPRDLHLKRTEEFGRIVDHIWGLIEDEVRSSFQADAKA